MPANHILHRFAVIMMTMFKALFAVQNSGEYTFTNSVWYSFLQYLSAIVYVYASYIGYAVMLVALAYQYGHAREKIDGDEFFDYVIKGKHCLKSLQFLSQHFLLRQCQWL